MLDPEVSIMESKVDTPSVNAILLPVLSAITLLLCIPPFFWHAKHRNLAPTVLITWILILNLFNVINAILWPTDDIAKWWNGKGLCDVEIRFLIASSAGVAGSLACIMRSLANVMNTDRSSLVPSRARRRRGMVFNVFFCFVFPIMLTLAYLIVQNNRFDIFSISGCVPNNHSSWVSVVLVFIWPPILSILDTYYCALVVIRLRRYRRQFSQILVCSNTNRAQFLRLFIISTILILCFLPIQLYVFYVNMNVHFSAFSFSRIHGENWSQIMMVPTGGVVRLDRWIYVAAGLLVFFFFGLGRDAVTMYRGWLERIGLLKYCPAWFSSHTQHNPPSTSSSGTSFGSTVALKAKQAIWWSFSRNSSFPTQNCSQHELVPSSFISPPATLLRHHPYSTADDSPHVPKTPVTRTGHSTSTAPHTPDIPLPLPQAQQKKPRTSIKGFFLPSKHTGPLSPKSPRISTQASFLRDVEGQKFQNLSTGPNHAGMMGVSTEISAGQAHENRNEVADNSVVVQTQVRQSTGES